MSQKFHIKLIQYVVVLILKKHILEIFSKLNYVFINYLGYFRNYKINRVITNQSLHNLFIFH